MHDDTLKYLDNLVAKLFTNNSFKEIQDKLNASGKIREDEHLALLDENNGPVEMEITAYVNKLFRTYTEMLGPWVGASFLSYAMEKYVIDNGIAESDDEMIERMKPYWRYTNLELQAVEMKKMVALLSRIKTDLKSKDITLEFVHSNPDVKKLFDQHLKDFEWFGTHHWEGEKFSAEKAIVDMKSVFESGDFAIEPLPESTPDEYADMWKLMADCVYWRTHAAEVTAKVVYHARPVLENLAKGWGMEYEDLLWLSSREISDAMKKSLNDIALPENYEERKEAYGANVDDRGHETVTVGEALEKLVAELVDDIPDDITELKGIVASRGDVVVGKVKVLITPKDIQKFEEGDILVAPETAPDYVPAMKLASAIITEAGGVTAHAAIVSRELGKPCIIGTKIATRVLRDGDKVEVDTETGIIKILK